MQGMEGRPGDRGAGRGAVDAVRPDGVTRDAGSLDDRDAISMPWRSRCRVTAIASAAVALAS
jgi:hypothetical protein